MPQLLVSKFIDNSTPLERAFESVAGMPLQIGMYGEKNFFSADHARIRKLCEENGSPIASFHAPNLDIFKKKEFFDMLQIIKSEYGVDNVTVHPEAGNPIRGLSLLKEFNEPLSRMGVFLLYENFDSSHHNKRWLPYAKNIAMVPSPHVYLTYDTSHVPIGRNIVADLDTFKSRLGMVHLSNKTRSMNHTPLFSGAHDMTPVLERLRAFSGFITLEYRPEYKDELRNDYALLHKMFS